MGWVSWSSVVSGVNTVGSWAGQGLKWTATKIGLGGALYVKNTGVQLLKQGLALDDAIPSLINNPRSRRILDNVGHILWHDVAPLLALNYFNNAVQIYARSGEQSEEEADWYSTYSVMLSVLTVANWAVTAYTWRQGAQVFIEVSTVGILGPRAFNNDSTRERVTYCIDEKCSLSRHLKGGPREAVLLLANQGLAELVKFIPYVGANSSAFINLISSGRYITRSAIPELCERHKSKFMVTEHILALGLSYNLTLAAMNYLLALVEPFAGMPPYMCYKALQQILLLYFVNIAAHMASPTVRPENTNFPLDILVVYEWIVRFLYDVIFSGLIKRIPLDFKVDPDSKALLPLSKVLQTATKALKFDLEVEIKPGVPAESNLSSSMFFGPRATKIKKIVLPRILRGTDELINDSIMFEHWPQMREGVLSTIEKIRAAGKSRVVKTANLAPKSAEKVLFLILGMPKKVTRVLLDLSRDQDFLDFLDALHDWFERHKIKTQVDLTSIPTHVLHGDTPLIEPVAGPQIEPMSAEGLKPANKPNERPTTSTEDLKPTKKKTESDFGASSFFPQLNQRRSTATRPAISASTLGSSG